MVGRKDLNNGEKILLRVCWVATCVDLTYGAGT